MEQTNPLQNGSTRAQNKGFRVMVDDTYVGYLNIGEKGVAAETVAQLQRPEVMSKILANATLHPYTEQRNMASVESIIAAAYAPTGSPDATATQIAAEFAANK